MNMEHLRKATSETRQKLGDITPTCALVLGSGWDAVTGELERKQAIPYAEISCLGKTGVKGHTGLLTPAALGSLDLLLFQGRRHWYEGAGWDPIAFPVLLCAELGIRSLVLTNAAGGLSPDFAPGDLMLITDHINSMGVNPLVGPHDPVWGARFPDQTHVYANRLQAQFRSAAREASIKLQEGVYVAVSGPSYETPAEIRAYQRMGGDAIGMSTVPEAMLANAAGLEVAGISCITNAAAGIASSPLSHAEVIEQSQQSLPRMRALLKRFLELEAAAHEA